MFIFVWVSLFVVAKEEKKIKKPNPEENIIWKTKKSVAANISTLRAPLYKMVITCAIQ